MVSFGCFGVFLLWNTTSSGNKDEDFWPPSPLWGEASHGPNRRMTLMLCFSLPPSGLNAGAFYALSTLLNRMVILHYPVRVFPKLAGPWEKEVPSLSGQELGWQCGMVCAPEIWREAALGLSPSPGGPQLCHKLVSVFELSFSFL